MKIIFSACCALLLLTTPTIWAQQAVQAPEKDVVVVDFFSRNRTVPAPYVEMIRAQVLQAFADRNRQEIIDAEASRTLAASVPGSGLTDPSTVVADMDAFLQMRAQQALALGARYLVTGAVADYKFEHVMLPSSDSRKPPIAGFKASFRVIVSAIDIRLGQRIPDEFYELSASAPVAQDADMAAIARLKGSMDFYVSNKFKIETVILDLCPPDRKGRIRELYIHSGNLAGVRPGDLFLVWEEVPIGGVMTRQKIGKLRVNDSTSPEVAKCKISAGDQEIVRAFSSGRGLICISDGKALFY